MSKTARAALQLAHSPDPDDAFMWWPITAGDSGYRSADADRFKFTSVLADIQALNERAERGEFEITGISAAQYPYVKNHYAITSCGASMGEGYGPKLVSRRTMSVEHLKSAGFPIAVPGKRTTAALLTSMILELTNDSDRLEAVPFAEVGDRVGSGEFDAGVVIHEGQLTYAEAGLHLVVDIGAWWYERFQLPLPLGLNVIRRDLADAFGCGALATITGILRDSIEFALAHRDEAIGHALRFGRGISARQADDFVRMYVNRLTVDCGEVGERAIRTLLHEAHKAGLTPEPGSIDVIRPAKRTLA